MKNKDLVSLGAADLKSEIAQLKKELFNLKFNASTTHLKDYSQFRKIRVRIAQAFTYLQKQERPADKKHSVIR